MHIYPLFPPASKLHEWKMYLYAAVLSLYIFKLIESIFEIYEFDLIKFFIASWVSTVLYFPISLLLVSLFWMIVAISLRISHGNALSIYAKYLLPLGITTFVVTLICGLTFKQTSTVLGEDGESETVISIPNKILMYVAWVSLRWSFTVKAYIKLVETTK